ncbi:hypothetical protein D3C84_1224920 [compost metagenome]
MMRFTIGTNKASTVNGKHNIKILAANIMDNLVIGPLQEGGVNGIYRLHAFHCKRCRHRCRMLFSNPYVNHPIRISLGKLH